MTDRSDVYSYDNLNRLTNDSTGTVTVSGGVGSISGSPTNTEEAQFL